MQDKDNNIYAGTAPLDHNNISKSSSVLCLPSLVDLTTPFDLLFRNNDVGHQLHSGEKLNCYILHHIAAAEPEKELARETASLLYSPL